MIELLKKIEYVLRKDSLTDGERIADALTAVRAAISKAEAIPDPAQTSSGATDAETIRKLAFELPPREQHRLAWFIAENIGYVLTEEPPHPDSPHHPDNKTWTPKQYWEFVGGFAGEFERNQMREVLIERGLWIVSRAAEPAQAVQQPVAYRWKYEDETSWTLAKSKPDHLFYQKDVICEPLYTLPSTELSAPDFADAYTAARRQISDRLAAEIVSRNAGDDEKTLFRPGGETDAELVRRIVATYLAVSRPQHSTTENTGK